MASRTTELALRVVSDVADAVAGLDAVGSAAAEMAADVDRATAGAADAGSRLDRVAGGADGLADKSSKATGALGALASGFALVGMEEYAAGLEAAAMATDFFSGVGDALSLVMETTALAKVKDTVVTGAQTVATTAQAAAAGVATAAQWAWNAAMSANPIGLIILAVVAAVAVVVLLYKHFDGVREVVDKVAVFVKSALGSVVEKVRDLIGWVRDRVPPAFEAVRDKVAAVKDAVVEKVQALRDAVVEKFEAARDRARDAFEAVREKVDTVKDKVVAAIAGLVDLVRPHLDNMLAPIQTIIEKVQDLIGWIGRIRLPRIDLPDLPGLGRAAVASPSLAPATRGTTTPAGPTTVINNQFDISNALDPVAVGQSISDAMARFDRIMGN
jgi:hypothetical protein